MTTASASPAVAAPRGFRGVAPAIALFFMSPFVAEFLLGDFSLDAIWLVAIVGPMYGGGVLVVREYARRLRGGWPTVVLLALAYGILEEGIVIQTLYNPNYLGLHLLRPAFVPALGMSAWWTPFVLTLHTVWSISVPIAVVEALFAERRTTPWLGQAGVGVSIALFAAGGLFLHFVQRRQDPFAASGIQLTSTWVAITLVVLVAARLRPAQARTGAVPSPGVFGLASLVWGLAFMGAHKVVFDWNAAAAQVALDVVAVGVLLVYGRRPAWTPVHVVATAGGALLAYALNGFPQEPVVGSKGAIDLAGNALFAAIAVVLLGRALRQERRLAGAAPGA